MKIANLDFNRKLGRFRKILKSSPKPKKQFVFQSALNGEDTTLDVCSFEEILPYSLLSIPVSTITPNDNAWIATSMLSRISDVTSNLVVIEDEFPIGTISAHEILDGLQKNPTSQFFKESVTKIMNADFYIDSRNVSVAEILKRMSRNKNPFTIIENDKMNFSQFSIRQVLEIGTMCKSDITISSFAKNHVSTFRRDDKIRDVIEILDQNRLALLEGEVSFINSDILLEKIKELNNSQNENLLELSASTFKTITPTLISERLSLADICKIMLNSKYPCVMTSEQVITPYEVLEILCKEI